MSNVLIVDDKWSICNSLVTGLKREGYKVVCANSAQAALLKLKESTFDFLITDMNMPEINGFILATIVKELHPQIRIIFMSAFDFKKYQQRYKDIVNYPCLSKPFKLFQLIKLLEIEDNNLKAAS